MRNLLLALLLLFGGFASAEQKISSGDLDIHYSLFNSSFLQASVASLYELERGPKTALLNISLVRQGQGEKARVKGQVSNLLGQSRQLQFKEIDEGSSVYYIAEVKMDSREVLKFDLSITDGNQQQHSLKFNQEVFPDE